jgi:hypothetical protein
MLAASSCGIETAIRIRPRKYNTRLPLLVLVLLLIHPTTNFAQTLVSGGTQEAFAQLQTVDLPGTSTTSITSSASMSVDSSGVCGEGFGLFVANNVPIDANGLPAQISYFGDSYLSTSQNNYLGVAVLNVSCSVAASGSNQSFDFMVPIYFCDTPAFPPIQAGAGLATSGCALTNPNPFNMCPIPTAGTVDSNAYNVSSHRENLAVYVPPSAGTLPNNQTPAIAVDVQRLYNGFTGSSFAGNGFAGFSPYLVRVACGPFSAFTNQ